jgi:hypothetical protein
VSLNLARPRSTADEIFLLFQARSYGNYWTFSVGLRLALSIILGLIANGLFISNSRLVDTSDARWQECLISA